jgi:hypothetical protein
MPGIPTYSIFATSRPKFRTKKGVPAKRSRDPNQSLRGAALAALVLLLLIVIVLLIGVLGGVLL